MVPIIQKNAFVLQKSQLEYQSMVTSSNSQNVTSKLSTLAASNADMESNEAKQLEYMSQMFTQQQASIDSQLKSINSNIEGLTKLIDNNIKSDCKLNLLG
jgi:hypothetical protein